MQKNIYNEFFRLSPSRFSPGPREPAVHLQQPAVHLQPGQQLSPARPARRKQSPY